MWHLRAGHLRAGIRVAPQGVTSGRRLSVGHLVGKSGLVVGGNSVEVPETGDREWRPFIGMDFTF